jgi:outer membrane protein assembly factor BamD (BamD/ComL family)
VSENIHPADADVERLRKLEEDIRLLKAGHVIRNSTDVARKAEHQLKNILQRCSDILLRDQIEEDIRQVQEILSEHHFKIANFYIKRSMPKGAESRLLEIARKYPDYSRMDEVLFLLGEVCLKDERPDEAASYLRKLICDHSSSIHIGRAFERLNQIGVRWEDCNNSDTGIVQ